MPAHSDDTIKTNLFGKIISVLETPGCWPNSIPFNVYRDFDMKKYSSESPPPAPYIFVGSRSTGVAVAFHPYMMIDITVDRAPLQMGGGMSSIASLFVNLITRAEGDGSRIMSVIKDNVTSAFFSGVHYAQWSPWSEEPVRIPEPMFSQGSLSQWIVATTQFAVL